MRPLSTTPTHDDHQDLVNRLLAAALQTRATIEQVHHTATLTHAEHPQAAADLADAATALDRIYHALLRAAGTGTSEEHP